MLQSPCLRPLLDWILLPKTPLTIILELPDLRRDLIHPIHLVPKPLASNKSNRKSQSMESNAFAKSSFRRAQVMLFLHQRLMNSCKIATPSVIFLPLIKAVWD